MYELFTPIDDKTYEIADNEYNFYFLDGLFGHGKTSFLTYFAVSNKDRYKQIFTNFKINLPNAIKLPKISKHVILNLNEKGEQCLLVLQESYMYFDRRYNTRRENKDIAESICQIRKTKIDVVADIPQHEFLDSRMLKFATGYLSAVGKLKHYPDYFMYQSRELKYMQGIEPTFLQGRRFILNNSLIYPFYNHREKTITQSSLGNLGIYS